MDAARRLEQRFRDSADDVLLVARDGRRFTYGRAWSNARNLAESWRARGLRPGDAVALVLPNDAAYPCCYLACAIGGFVACPVLPDLTPAARRALLELLRPALVLSEPPPLDGSLAPPAAGEIALGADPEAPFAVFFSSGTTGKPKGICHSLAAVAGGALSFAALSGMGRHTRLYHVLPMGYMAGFLNTMLAPLLAGGRIVEGPPFSPGAALDFWRRPLREGVDTLSLVPSIAAALCRLTRDRDAARAAAAGLTAVHCTAAPPHRALRGRFLEVFDRPLQDCYGVTELGGPLSVQAPEDARALTEVSTPLPELELAIRPGPNGEDELCIGSPFHMLGYLDEAGLRPPELAGGLFPTGDIATLADGKLRITGRCKDLIIRGGVNVVPMPIENAISEVAGVEDVAVVGVPQDLWGEITVACVTPKPGADPQALGKEIRARCRERLGPHDRPDEVLMTVRMPRSQTGKIQKRILREWASARLPDRFIA